MAHRVSAISTASQPQIMFQNDTVQRCGDQIIRWADVIVAAVDSVSARAWLAERARLHGKPLVEGGFSGPEFNFSAFSADPGADCYRCFNPARCRQRPARSTRSMRNGYILCRRIQLPPPSLAASWRSRS